MFPDEEEEEFVLEKFLEKTGLEEELKEIFWNIQKLNKSGEGATLEKVRFKLNDSTEVNLSKRQVHRIVKYFGFEWSRAEKCQPRLN